MAVRVRYFASLRERKQRDEELVDPIAGETLADLYARVFPDPSPGAARLPIAYARNRETARPDDLVEDGDEIAFLPPIGGG